MSFDEECDWRLENLFKESHIWLIQSATNITKNAENAEDLVSDLYCYIHKKRNQKIFWGVSYNLMYCYRYLQTRWINKIDKLKRISMEENMGKYDREDEEYDVDLDISVMNEYQNVLDELKRMKGTRQFAQASIYEMYWLTDDKMMDVANKIGISKSTTFTSIKKVREHLSRVIKNPFNE
jgi:DNA-directed RNA polymerase specialized sigma24 family protein